MAYDEELADRVRELVSDAVEKKMFGGLAFLIGGHMSVAVSGQGGLMVRCDPNDTGRLLTEPGTELFEMRGREMAGWLRVTAEAVADDEVLGHWVDVGVGYASSLPPKR